jgi:hypothetical protein
MNEQDEPHRLQRVARAGAGVVAWLLAPARWTAAWRLALLVTFAWIGSSLSMLAEHLDTDSIASRLEDLTNAVDDLGDRLDDQDPQPTTSFTLNAPREHERNLPRQGDRGERSGGAPLPVRWTGNLAGPRHPD